MPAAFQWRLRVRFSDTDISGRAHYSAMFRFMEAAEDEFLRSLGLPYAAVEKAKAVSFPRVHVEAQFMVPLHYDEVVDMEVTVERVGETAFTLYFDASKDGKAVARGRVTAVCVSVETERPVLLPAEFADALRQAMAAGD